MTIYKPHLQNLRVGFTYGTPDASSNIQLDDTTTGFLMNRMTTTQKNAISSPATGLLVYDTTLSQFSFYNGSAWTQLETGTGSAITLAGPLTTVGAYGTTLTMTATTALTLPTSGTLLTTTGVGVSVSALCSGTLTANTNTTLAAVPGLTVPVLAGASYIYEVYLQGVSGASGGLKVSMYGSSTTATFTAGYADSWMYNGTTVAGQTQTQAASGNQIATNAIYSSATITGSFTTTASTGAGNFAVMAAQNTSNGTSTTVLAGSYVCLTRVS